MRGTEVMGGSSGTHTLRLPGGLALDDGQLLRNAVLRPLCGVEEEWLAEHPGLANAKRVSWLLGRCLVSIGDLTASSDLARDLLVGDRDYLVLQLRRLTLGEAVRPVVDCAQCGQKLDLDFNVSDVPVEERPHNAVWEALQLSSEGSGGVRSIRYRLPTGGDQEAVLGMRPDEAVEALFSLCVEGAAELPETQKALIIEAMDKRAPQVDLELDVACPDCGAQFITPLDVTSYFFDEMRANAHLLLREVHTLAFYYHWTEGEILGLGRARRRTYLSMLSDSLERD